MQLAESWKLKHLKRVEAGSSYDASDLDFTLVFDSNSLSTRPCMQWGASSTRDRSRLLACVLCLCRCEFSPPTMPRKCTSQIGVA